MTTHPYSALGNTRTGQTSQLNHAYHGMADKLEREKVDQSNYDDLSSLSPHQLRQLVMHLRHKLDDAQALIEEMSKHANGDQIADTSKKVGGWSTTRVAVESGKSIATICRNARELGGIKIGSDWIFPVGTTYTGGRGKKNKKAK